MGGQEPAVYALCGLLMWLLFFYYLKINIVHKYNNNTSDATNICFDG